MRRHRGGSAGAPTELFRPARLHVAMRWCDVQLCLHVVDPDPVYLERLLQLLASSVSVRALRFQTVESYLSFIERYYPCRSAVHAALITSRLDRPGGSPRGLEILARLERLGNRITPVMLAQSTEREYTGGAPRLGAAAVVPRGPSAAMRIASVLLFTMSQRRIAIRRRQLRGSLVALGAAGVSLLVALLRSG